VAHLTRHELKQDELRSGVEHLEEFFKQRGKEIATVVGIIIVVVGLAIGLKVYAERKEAAASADLGAALKTFNAYVGPASGALLPGMETFETSEEKFKKAREEFLQVIEKYSRPPEPKAVAIARYHLGLCQAELGEHEAAVKTLQEATQSSDSNVASLSKFALAGELAKAGKRDEALKLYEELAARPTAAVPEAMAKLALADVLRASDPARARALYQDLEKRFSSDVTLAQALKEQIESLPQ
jgi:tetratricopeptide (TPR) repeat protein